MNMVEKLSMLYNTLSLISTKGNDTKLMAQSLQFLEGLITEERMKLQKETEKDTEVATE